MVFSLNFNFDKYSCVLISRKIWSLVEILLETKISPVTPVIVGHVTTLPVMKNASLTKVVVANNINVYNIDHLFNSHLHAYGFMFR